MSSQLWHSGVSSERPHGAPPVCTTGQSTFFSSVMISEKSSCVLSVTGIQRIDVDSNNKIQLAGSEPHTAFGHHLDNRDQAIGADIQEKYPYYTITA